MIWNDIKNVEIKLIMVEINVIQKIKVEIKIVP